MLRKSLQRLSRRLSRKKEEEGNDQPVVVFKGLCVSTIVQLAHDVASGVAAEGVELVVVRKDAQVEGLWPGQTLKLVQDNGESVVAHDPYNNRTHDLSWDIVERKERGDWTTEDVSEYVVWPATRERRCVYLDLVDQETEVGKEFKGTFVSQARMQRFADLVGGLESHFKDSLNTSFVWLDLFSANQPLLKGYGVKDAAVREEINSLLTHGLHTALRKFDSVILFLGSWTEAFPLTRAWCIWELYGALSSNVKFSLLFSPNEEKRFLDMLTNSATEVQTAVVNLDARRAKCFDEEDLKMIQSKVESLDGGWVTLNAHVKAKMFEWLLKSTKAFIDQRRQQLVPEDGEEENIQALVDFRLVLFHGARLVAMRGDHALSLQWLDEGYGILERFGFGSTDAAANILFEKAWLLVLGNQLDHALEIYSKVREVYETLVEQDPSKHIGGLAKVHNDIGITLESMGKAEQALEEMDKSLEYWTELGESGYLGKAGCLHSRSGPLKNLSRFDEALESLEQSLELKRKALSAFHPSIGRTLNTMAVVLLEKGEAESAMKLFQECRDITVENVGEDSMEMATTEINIASTLQTLGRLEEAFETAKNAKRILTVLGVAEDHPLVNIASSLVANLSEENG